MVVERDHRGKKKAHLVDFVVERDELNLKKAHLEERSLIRKGAIFLNFIFLSDEFYQTYSACTEIEQKRTRPYVRVCVRIDGNIFAIPLRSHINHPHVLWTDKNNQCGLDFSKAVIINQPIYVDKTRTPKIRQNEFDALRGKEHVIKQRMAQYIREYTKAKARLDIPRNRTLCQYSTLQYFEPYIMAPRRR